MSASGCVRFFFYTALLARKMSHETISSSVGTQSGGKCFYDSLEQVIQSVTNVTFKLWTTKKEAINCAVDNFEFPRVSQILSAAAFL